MDETRIEKVWIGNNLYNIEYPSQLNLEGLKTHNQQEEAPQAQVPEAPANDEWDERKGIFYTLIQMIFAFLILTQGASTLKSVIIAALLLLMGLSQLGYISWSAWFLNAAQIVQPAQIDEQQQPIWKTIFLLSINFLMSLFPGLNEIG